MDRDVIPKSVYKSKLIQKEMSHQTSRKIHFYFCCQITQTTLSPYGWHQQPLHWMGHSDPGTLPRIWNYSMVFCVHDQTNSAHQQCLVELQSPMAKALFDVFEQELKSGLWACWAKPCLALGTQRALAEIICLFLRTSRHLWAQLGSGPKTDWSRNSLTPGNSP